MAEAIIGIMGGAIAIIQATTVILDGMNKVKDTPKNLQKLSLELQDFGMVLKQIEDHCLPSQLGGATQKALRGCAEMFKELHDLVAPFQEVQENGSKLKQYVQGLRIRPKESEIENAVARLQSQKLTLSLALTAGNCWKYDHRFNMTLFKRVIDEKMAVAAQQLRHEPDSKVEDLLGIDVGQIKDLWSLDFESVRDLKDVVDERKRQQFLESLCTPDYQQDRIQIKDASSTTCEWIWRREAYVSFRSDPGSRILHVYGNAGSGKSVLAKYIWRGLSKEFGNLPERDTQVLLYYCCNERTRPDESASSILRALLHQFLWQRPSSFHKIVQRNELMQSHSFSGSSTGWTFDSLWCIFMDIVTNARDQVYCIIDGLDECENESTGTLLSLLPDLLEKCTSNAFAKFLLTSRAEGHIVDALEEHATSITITSDTTRNDVELYVGERLVGLKRRLRLNSEEEQDLRRLLAERANGMFLWVERAIKDLERTYGIRAKTVVNRVRSLPSGLNALYERMLSKINAMCDDQDTLQLVRQMLTWICLAARPLTLNELRITLAMEIDTEYLDLLEPLQNITYDLLGLCGSFVEIVRGNDDGIPVGTDGQVEINGTQDLSATVRLIHQSAKEYLVDSVAIPDSLSRFCIDGRTGNAEMARICLAYLLSHDFEIGPVPGTNADCFKPGGVTASIEQKLERFGLLQYASRYWPAHVREGGSEDVNMHACRLLGNNGNHFRNWQQISIFASKCKPMHHFAGIHVASALGLDAVLGLLLDQGSDIDARDSNSGTALHYATAMGNVEMVKLLVSRGANIEAREHDNSTALHFAASTGNVAMTKLLLDYGAKIAYEDKEVYPALHVAAWAGHVEVVKLLLDRGAEIDAVYRDGRTACHLAAERGNLDVFRLLRERGARADARYLDVFIRGTIAGSLREFKYLLARPKVKSKG